MEARENELTGINELHLCEAEAYKAFRMYLGRIMPDIGLEIVSVVYHDHRFVIKTKPPEEDSK